MSNLNESNLITAYQDCLKDRGYVGEKIPKQKSKTSDLFITKDSETYFNEFKSPEPIPNETTGMFMFKTTYSKLLTFIGTSVKQLKVHDPNPIQPWVITFDSCYMQLKGSDLAETPRCARPVQITDAFVSRSFTRSAL
jgi:hypothetical protein